MLKFIQFALIFLFIVNAATASEKTASPKARRVKKIVDAAYAYVNEHLGDMKTVQKALEEDPRFIDHDNQLYVFLHCYNAEKREVICCAQGKRPELAGKNMSNLRTPNGRLIFHEIMNKIEDQGTVWIEYEWLNPYTKTIQTKRSYMRKLVFPKGRTAWIGSGFWKE